MNDILFLGPTEIILDTHAIGKIVPNQRVINWIRERCHFLIIPDLTHEYTYYKAFLGLMEEMFVMLKGKYVLDAKPYPLPSSLEDSLRRHGCKGCDFTVAGVAYRRRRSGRLVVIISNDPCFHDTPELRSEQIFSIRVDEFIDCILK